MRNVVDLIYLGDNQNCKEVEDLFARRFPNLVQEGESDSIHGYRLSLEGTVDIKEYFNFLIDNNLAQVSFKVQMGIRTECDDQRCIHEIMNERS